MRLLYEFSNDGATMAHRGDPEGLCFGYSSVWCVKLQRYKGQNARLTIPSQMEAFPLQQRAEMISDNWSAKVPHLIRLWGHKCSMSKVISYRMVALKIALDNGCFVIDIGDHWVAAAHYDGKYTFFDANEGMTLFTDRQEFIAGVLDKLEDYKNDPDPDNGWEDTHKLYKITD